MTILDAFASGVPVIAVRRCAAATLVQDRVTGLTNGPGDPADFAAPYLGRRRPQEMDAFVQTARGTYVAYHTTEASYERLSQIYETAMRRGRARGEGGQAHWGATA